MNEKSATLLPSFEPWGNYETDQLEAIVKAWRIILSWESWSKWHEYGLTCISEIEAEIQIRNEIPF